LSRLGLSAASAECAIQTSTTMLHSFLLLIPELFSLDCLAYGVHQ